MSHCGEPTHKRNNTFIFVIVPRVFLLDAVALSRSARAHSNDAWLSHSEQVRLDAIASSARKQLYIATRLALRACLAQCYPATHWTAWGLASENNQPPTISQSPLPAGTDTPLLSLSHSESLVAVGVAQCKIGVDIEIQRKERPWTEMLALIGSAEEHRRFARDSGTRPQEAFLRIWTLKEAYFKHQGSGLDFQEIRTLTTRERGDAAAPSKASGVTWEGVYQHAPYTLAACTPSAVATPQLITGNLPTPTLKHHWLYT